MKGGEGIRHSHPIAPSHPVPEIPCADLCWAKGDPARRKVRPIDRSSSPFPMYRAAPMQSHSCTLTDASRTGYPHRDAAKSADLTPRNQARRPLSSSLADHPFLKYRGRISNPSRVAKSEGKIWRGACSPKNPVELQTRCRPLKGPGNGVKLPIFTSVKRVLPAPAKPLSSQHRHGLSGTPHGTSGTESRFNGNGPAGTLGTLRRYYRNGSICPTRADSPSRDISVHSLTLYPYI